jgi:hypothetical protein
MPTVLQSAQHIEPELEASLALDVSLPVVFGFLILPFMPPRVHHQENKHHKIKTRSTLAPVFLPELLEAAQANQTVASPIDPPTRSKTKKHQQPGRRAIFEIAADFAQCI